MKMPLARGEVTRCGLRRMGVEAGLAAEQTLLEMVCEGERDALTLAWKPSDRALVMPRRHERLAGFSLARQALLDKGWPILFRLTGGEPVPQSPQVINVAVAQRCRVDSAVGHLEWGYRRLGEPWCAWLESLGVAKADLGPVAGSYCDGRFNVRIAGRKLVGTAQRWRRVRGCRDMVVLVHGAMQVEGSPAELVDIVNDYQRVAGETRFQSERHIALREALPDFRVEMIDRLLARYPS